MNLVRTPEEVNFSKECILQKSVCQGVHRAQLQTDMFVSQIFNVMEKRYNSNYVLSFTHLKILAFLCVFICGVFLA